MSMYVTRGVTVGATYGATYDATATNRKET
jgi:hypothetical protein